jgi:hypothetical protein
VNDKSEEIRQIIEFYDSKGWCWLSLVAFKAQSAIGTWPPHPLRFSRVGSGRPRKIRTPSEVNL